MLKQNSRKKGDKYEEIFIKTLNSGAFNFDKGDAKSNTHLIEIKGTSKKSYSITTKLLQKIWDEAFDSNKFPMFGVVIDNNGVRWLLQLKLKREVV